ncbi:MAG: glycoside hydrolase [Deltaproteobacteria bacterium]|nr:glycoside hydrolase [Deltaproteobacteria bacterium]
MVVFGIRIATCLAGLAGVAFVTKQANHRTDEQAMLAVQTRLEIDTQHTTAEVDPRFLSVAIDMANVVGGQFWDPSRQAAAMGTAKVPAYDFDRPQLRYLASQLAPAYLRIGGTDADRVIYDLDSRAPPAPSGSYKLSRARWDAVNHFAADLDLRIIFTLNAGALSRNSEGRWNPETAKPLLADARAHNYPVDVWELGNELNVYPLIHGQYLSPSGYADDMQVARWLVDEITPHARLAGPAVAFWPLVGEGLPFAKRFMKNGGHLLDIITWHYYPQQSFRCPVATNRAHAGQVLRPSELQDVDRWAGFVEGLRTQYGPSAQTWLGETGGAQCGGEPELSDRFGSSLWWVDELGRMARRGQRVVVRQTLSGGDYGLIDDKTLAPNPDYWASLLWRRLMGTKVLAVSAQTPSAVQAYAHCQAGAPGAVAMALVNVHPSQPIKVDLPPLGERAEVYLVQADGLRAKEVALNGIPLRLAADGKLPQLHPQELITPDGSGFALRVPALAYAFVVLPQANATACH